jgi:beta-mannanase
MIGDAKFGVYVKGAVWDKSRLHALEDSVGHEFAIVQWFTSWPAPFETYYVKRLLEAERIPLITWQSSHQSLDSIVAGEHDAYIRSWADAAAALEETIYLRLFPEMNGDWTTWHGEPEKLIKAWQHIVEIFREEKANNVLWVWSPNITDEPSTPSNRMELYYPGNKYVDILGLDGFNWGTSRPWTAWKSFEETFAEAYSRITSLGEQALWLTEIASTEEGGDKAEWVKAMLSSTAFPKVEALIWFNEVKETDWRMESSLASSQAFREWFVRRSDGLLADH